MPTPVLPGPTGRLLVSALLVVTLACGGRGTHAASETSADVSAASTARVPTARRVRVDLTLARTTLSATDETFPFTLRVTNTAREARRVDFTGDPLFPRGPRDKVKVPALWYTIERDDRASSSGSVTHDFAMRDTVLAAGESMEVPVEHSLREVGMGPGNYRLRAGIGAHASEWVEFVVTP